jgi:hypothetical protein
MEMFDRIEALIDAPEGDNPVGEVRSLFDQITGGARTDDLARAIEEFHARFCHPGFRPRGDAAKAAHERAENRAFPPCQGQILMASVGLKAFSALWNSLAAYAVSASSKALNDKGRLVFGKFPCRRAGAQIAPLRNWPRHGTGLGAPHCD